MYTYAFLKTPSLPLKLSPGITGSLEILSAQGLSAVVEPNLQAENLPDSDEELMQAVLIHDQITCEVFQQTTLLPVRFGTFFHSEQALFDHLVLHQQKYRQQLEHFQGKAEYCLQGVPVEPSSETLTSLSSSEPPLLKGRNYFLAKKQLHQQQLERQQQQAQQWLQLVEWVRHTYPEIYLADSQPNRERIYLLIPQTSELELQKQFHQWQRQYPDWQFSLEGALPPYHFL